MNPFQERTIIRETFLRVYEASIKNRLTPNVYDFYGWVGHDGKVKGQYICELSQGEFGGGKIPIFGVTVIRYNKNINAWVPDVDLSVVKGSRKKAEEYASKLAFRGNDTN